MRSDVAVGDLSSYSSLKQTVVVLQLTSEVLVAGVDANSLAEQIVTR
jgi:hypothetical protein